MGGVWGVGGGGVWGGGGGGGSSAAHELTVNSSLAEPIKFNFATSLSRRQDRSLELLQS